MMRSTDAVSMQKQLKSRALLNYLQLSLVTQAAGLYSGSLFVLGVAVFGLSAGRVTIGRPFQRVLP
ncbi:MAG: hypothetical protein QOH71_3590 [Blastocatellia bacterium]|nr:hypothetical protein [Blastocatellia bacterium]